jgi:hypothetical protein
MFGYLRRRRELSDPISHAEFFRLSEPLITFVGYGAAAAIGWFVSPAIALAIFLVFPAIQLVRVRSADH